MTRLKWLYLSLHTSVYRRTKIYLSICFTLGPNNCMQNILKKIALKKSNVTLKTYFSFNKRRRRRRKRNKQKTAYAHLSSLTISTQIHLVIFHQFYYLFPSSIVYTLHGSITSLTSNHHDCKCTHLTSKKKKISIEFKIYIYKTQQQQ